MDPSLASRFPDLKGIASPENVKVMNAIARSIKGLNDMMDARVNTLTTELQESMDKIKDISDKEFVEMKNALLDMKKEAEEAKDIAKAAALTITTVGGQRRQEGGGANDGGRLKHREARDFLNMMEDYTGEMGSKSFTEFTGRMETYLHVLAPEAKVKALLTWIGKRSTGSGMETEIDDQTITEAAEGDGHNVVGLDGGNGDLWRLISRAMGPVLHKVCRSHAAIKIRPIAKSNGFEAWEQLAHWFSARSTMDRTAHMALIMSPGP